MLSNLPNDGYKPFFLKWEWNRKDKYVFKTNSCINHVFMPVSLKSVKI